MTQMSFRGVKGMPDIYLEEAARWQVLEQQLNYYLERAGFGQIRLPVLEELGLYMHSVGEASDIVRKEMYTLKDGGERHLALRPEGTAGVVRAFIEHTLAQPGEELRLWYLGPMFRYERPQKGRQRQFHQLGAEVFGNPSPYLDAELIALSIKTLEYVGLKNLHVKINSLGQQESRQQYRQALVDFALPHKEHLCQDCQSRLTINPLRMLDCKEKNCQAIFSQAPVPLDYLAPACKEHFQTICKNLDALGVTYHISPRLVRGLDYYTRTVFEIESTDLGAQNTICAGGRYDDLVERFGGSKTPAFGFAIGIERLMLLLGEQLTAKEKPLRCAWIALDEMAWQEGLGLLMQLRKMGIIAQQFSHKGSLKAQMRTATQQQCDIAILQGEDERRHHQWRVKNLQTSEQVDIAANLPTLQELLVKWWPQHQKQKL